MQMKQISVRVHMNNRSASWTQHCILLHGMAWHGMRHQSGAPSESWCSSAMAASILARSSISVPYTRFVPLSTRMKCVCTRNGGTVRYGRSHRCTVYNTCRDRARLDRGARGRCAGRGCGAAHVVRIEERALDGRAAFGELALLEHLVLGGHRCLLPGALILDVQERISEALQSTVHAQNFMVCNV